MEKLNVLLIEDDSALCQEFLTKTNEMADEFNLVGMTNDSETAIKMMEENFPEAVVLDLELNAGKGSGFDFLNRLKTFGGRKPFVLVSTNNISAVSHSIARDLGADFILTKTQKDFSAQTVLDFLKITKSTILEKFKSTSSVGNKPTEHSEIFNKKLTAIICKKFNAIGINPKAVGYNYLVEAVIMVINDKTQNLPIHIGKKFGKTPNSVERAMQNAINQTWFSSDINVLLSQYTARIKSEKGVPTITEFVYFYARDIKNEIL